MRTKERPKLTVRDLKRRYFNGERDFANVDLSGVNLQGLNLRDIDLTQATLSHAQLQGTKFTNATLNGAYFDHVQAGLQRRWIVLYLAILLPITALLSFISSVFSAAFINLFFQTEDIVKEITVIPGILVTAMVFSVFLVIARQGLTFKTFNTILGLSFCSGVGAGEIALANAGTVYLVMAGAGAGAVAVAGIGVWTVAVVGAGAGIVAGVKPGTTSRPNRDSARPKPAPNATPGPFPGALPSSLTGSLTNSLSGPGTGAVALAVAAVGAVAGAVTGAGPGAIAGAVAGAGAVLAGYAAWRALKGDEKFTVVRRLALAIGAVGGTSFAGADLTGATMAQATLKNTNFAPSRTRATLLTRVRWHGAKQLELARASGPLLTNPRLRALVVGLQGAGQDLAGANLRGANLAGANLAEANLAGAMLNDGVLHGADLYQANLSEAGCIGTDFTRARLTGATLDAWNIDSTTRFQDVHCDYVYVRRQQQERRPNSGTFAPGEFTALFQKALDTVDLTFHNGLDWEPFLRTLDQIQADYPEANVDIQTIENKGDGVVVVKLRAASKADKPAIHERFVQGYAQALAVAERRYKAQWRADQREIELYRQQNANMRRIAELLAQRPINVEANAQVESMTMQDHDHSRHITIGGDAIGSAITAGDGNTTEVHYQAVPLPQPTEVNIQVELQALGEILATLNDPVTTGIAHKLEAAAHTPNPDKTMVATTLETGLSYATSLQGFAEAIDALKPHVQNAAGWLGQYGQGLLPLVGLAAL